MTNGITMTNAVIKCILSRSSTKYYDPTATLTDDQIRELVRIGTTAPTSFHLQNWRFIAVRTPEAKARLSPIAWSQPAITESSVTFIVCGQLADSSEGGEIATMLESNMMRGGTSDAVSRTRNFGDASEPRLSTALVISAGLLDRTSSLPPREIDPGSSTARAWANAESNSQQAGASRRSGHA
jgi:nitroreductase